MTPTILFLFAATVLLLTVTPGPTVLLSLSNGLNHGVRPALFGVAGAVLSDVLLIAAVFFGLGALLSASELAFQAIKWCGVAYLFYLGVCAFRTRAVPLSLAKSDDPAMRGGALFLKSFFVAIANPKGLLFFSAFLPQFLEPSLPQLPQFMMLGAVFALIDCAVMVFYATAGARAARFLQNTTAVKWFNRSCGTALIGMSGALAFYRRGA